MSGRELLLVVLAQVFLVAAMTGLRLASPLLALSLGYSAGAVGALVSLFALSQIFLAIPAGKYADRHGVKRPMRPAVILAVIAMVALTAAPTIGVLCVAAMILGGSSGVTLIVLQRHTGRAATSILQRRQFFSWLAIAPAISNFVGPFTAGFIIDHAGEVKGDLMSFRICFAVLGILPLVTWMLVRNVRELPKETGDTSTTPTQAWDLLRDPCFRYILFVNWLQSSVWDTHSFLVPVLGYERGYSASSIGIILAAFAISAALMRLALPLLAERFSEKEVIAVSFVITVLVFAIYPLAKLPGQMAACSMILGAALGAVQPMIMSLLTQVTPESRQGEALGLRVVVLNASNFLAPMVTGSFGALMGVSAVFWGISALVAAGAPALRHIRVDDDRSDEAVDRIR